MKIAAISDLRVYQSIAIALSLLLSLSTCGEYGVSADQCWNPKLLRVKVGETILDLPHGIEVDLWDGGRPDGLLNIKFEDQKGNRQTCQRKDRVPLDYGPRPTLFMRDRPDQGDYTNGALFDYKDPINQDLIDFSRLSSLGLTENPPYLSEFTEAAGAIFVGYLPDNRMSPGKSRRYIFSNGAREYTTYCLIWTDDPAGSSPRPPFPFSCIPGWRFLMGDLIVAINARAKLVEPSAGHRLVAPPKTWPLKWAAVLKEISSYRVNIVENKHP